MENIKNSTKTINLKYQLQRGMENLNCLMDYFLCQIFKIILSISKKKNQKVIDNPPTKIYINKIEKTGLTPETMELPFIQIFIP